jgi:hypothetical protein
MEDFKIGNIEIGKLGNWDGSLGTKNQEQRITPEEPRTTSHEQRTSSVEPRTTNYEPRTAPPFEIHVISCTQQPLSAPEKLAPNIWFHPLHVSKWGWLRTGYQGCVRAVRQKLKEIQPDIVHA